MPDVSSQVVLTIIEHDADATLGPSYQLKNSHTTYFTTLRHRNAGQKEAPIRHTTMMQMFSKPDSRPAV